MQYQLVIQFPEILFQEIDKIAALEDRLEQSLINAEVDGHDIGSGECNIFIHTNYPETTLETVKNILAEQNFNTEYVKIAYREIRTDQYINLWLNNLEEFIII